MIYLTHIKERIKVIKSTDELKVGDYIYVPIIHDKLSEGKILDIDRKGIYDPKLKYEVEFDDLNIITFFTEEAVSNWLNRNEFNENRDT